jgi:hypothetical protein
MRRTDIQTGTGRKLSVPVEESVAAAKNSATRARLPLGFIIVPLLGLQHAADFGRPSMI